MTTVQIEATVGQGVRHLEIVRATVQFPRVPVEGEFVSFTSVEGTTYHGVVHRVVWDATRDPRQAEATISI